MPIYVLALALFALPTAALSQGIHIGPGGVGVDTGIQDEYQHHEYAQHGDHYAHMCAELRQACMHKHELGEEGHGNCARYRQRCGHD
jgi:hypothetical protein